MTTVTRTENAVERAYSFIEIKSVDEEKRIIRGTATTPEESRRCSKCGVLAPISAFGMTRATAGRVIRRAQCRKCYNVHRRAHYARPDVNAEKNIKRRAYEHRQDVLARRRILRSAPEVREREREAVKKYRAQPGVKERHRAKKSQYLSSLHGRSLALLQSASIRARKKALPFELDEAWVRQRLAANVCEVTGLAFDFTRGVGRSKGAKNPLAPSIDQIRAGHGYTKQNSRIVLASVNNALGEWGDEHLLKIAVAMLTRRGWLVRAPRCGSSEEEGDRVV